MVSAVQPHASAASATQDLASVYAVHGSGGVEPHPHGAQAAFAGQAGQAQIATMRSRSVPVHGRRGPGRSPRCRCRGPSSSWSRRCCTSSRRPDRPHRRDTRGSCRCRFQFRPRSRPRPGRTAAARAASASTSSRRCHRRAALAVTGWAGLAGQTGGAAAGAGPTAPAAGVDRRRRRAVALDGRAGAVRRAGERLHAETVVARRGRARSRNRRRHSPDRPDRAPAPRWFAAIRRPGAVAVGLAGVGGGEVGAGIGAHADARGAGGPRRAGVDRGPGAEAHASPCQWSGSLRSVVVSTTQGSFTATAGICCGVALRGGRQRLRLTGHQEKERGKGRGSWRASSRGLRRKKQQGTGQPRIARVPRPAGASGCAGRSEF